MIMTMSEPIRRVAVLGGRSLVHSRVAIRRRWGVSCFARVCGRNSG
jgi:hypothetical protein